jgi:hypothetical protein
MRIVEAFHVRRPCEVVFDYLADPSKLGEWQTSSRSVEPLTAGPPGLGSRFRERTKPPGVRAADSALSERRRLRTAHTRTSPSSRNSRLGAG